MNSISEDERLVRFMLGFGAEESADFVFRPPSKEQMQSEKFKKAEKIAKSEMVIYL